MLILVCCGRGIGQHVGQPCPGTLARRRLAWPRVRRCSARRRVAQTSAGSCCGAESGVQGARRRQRKPGERLGVSSGREWRRPQQRSMAAACARAEAEAAARTRGGGRGIVGRPAVGAGGERLEGGHAAAQKSGSARAERRAGGEDVGRRWWIRGKERGALPGAWLQRSEHARTASRPLGAARAAAPPACPPLTHSRGRRLGNAHSCSHGHSLLLLLTAQSGVAAAGQRQGGQAERT
jgi:hypothetical protein